MAAQKIALIGFGSQGRAWARRLSKARVELVVGLRAGSKSRNQARKLGYKVETPERAAHGSSVVALLVPDHAGRKVFTRLERHLRPDCLVVFAAGYPLVFPTPLRSAMDVVLVAPHGPGSDLEAGEKMSAFVAVANDRSGRAGKRARTLALSLGLGPLYDTSPRQEALGDLFGEQALLCGGLLGLTAQVSRRMIKGGVPPAHAWLETVGQLERLAGLLARGGVETFWREISDCAAAGSKAATPVLFGPGFERALDRVWKDIESGRFARRFERQGRPGAMPQLWRVLAGLEEARRAPTKKGGRTGRPVKKRSR